MTPPVLQGSIDIFRNETVSIHSYCSPMDGEFVRSQIIETPNSVVVLDVQLTRKYAREVRRYAESLNKPIERVMVSHMHPDHWFGIEEFQDLPLYALKEVQEQLGTLGDFWIGLRKPEFGDQIPDHAIVPAHTLPEGPVTIDGVQFVFHKIEKAECITNLMVELPDFKTLLPQDLVYNNVYLFVGELHGPERNVLCFEGWLDTLQDLKTRGFELVIPGHGEPTDSGIFDRCMTFLQAAREVFQSTTDPEQFKAQLIERFPEYRLPLLLDFSAMTLYRLM